MILILFFVFGAIIGSFLNVVILRYNTGMTLSGRSGCFSCGKTLSWYELIPVVSFLVLRGKCAGCKSKISWQYPLVELLTGVLFVAVASQYGAGAWGVTQLISFILDLAVMSFLVVITVYDLRHTIIPDSMSFAFAALALVKLVIAHGGALLHYPLVLDLLAGPILFVPFFLIWLVSRGKWMGLGDAKLAVGIGFLNGLAGGVSSLVLGVWIGAVVSILWMAILKITGRSGLTMHSEIPFAPYLILGTLLVFFFHFDFFGLTLLLL